MRGALHRAVSNRTQRPLQVIEVRERGYGHGPIGLPYDRTNDIFKDGLLVGEPPIDGRLGGARRPGDCGNGRAVVSEIEKQGQRPFTYILTELRRLALGGPTASSGTPRQHREDQRI